jgi:hypothetical protein
MKRQVLFLFTLSTVLGTLPLDSADAAGFGRGGTRVSARGRGHGHGHGRGFKKGFGRGFGSGVFVDDDDSDFADLYRELLDNVPYFALHPPVYYSHPVPRTYGYSPFAYGPWVMTPDAAHAPQPLTIINPYVPDANQKSAIEASDRSTAISTQPEPLVIINPYVTPTRSVASNASNK